MNDDGIYCIKSVHDQHEIMRQYMFLSENKKMNSIRKESVSPNGSRSKNRDEFIPKITQKSRNMAETFKKNFTEVSIMISLNIYLKNRSYQLY